MVTCVIRIVRTHKQKINDELVCKDILNNPGIIIEIVKLLLGCWMADCTIVFLSMFSSVILIFLQLVG